MDKIPLFKVLMDPAVPDVVRSTIESGTVTEGPRVVELETRLQELLGSPLPPVTVNSGTTALELACKLAGIRPGDEVVSTPITCAATNLAIVHAGASIVWADVDPVTGLLDPESVARKVTPRTRAVVGVDWGGVPCDWPAIKVAARGLPVIEDAAHAFLARDGRDISIAAEGADFVAYSFQAIKHLTTGDGGALVLRRQDHLERARKLRWFGIDRRAPGLNIDKTIHEAGYKWHMNDLDASIGLANLECARRAVDQHRDNARYYGENLRNGRIMLPPAHAGSSWWLYTLLCQEGRQAEFIAHMAGRGIDCSLVHTRNDRHPALGPAPAGDLPGVDAFSVREVAIPVGWWLTSEDRERIVEAVSNWV